MQTSTSKPEAEASELGKLYPSCESVSLKGRLLEALFKRFPAMKAYQAEKGIEKYIDVMLSQIASSVTAYGFTDDQISLPLATMREEVGRISIGKKKQWITGLMHESPETSLICIDFKGNAGKNSRVSLNPLYEKGVWAELLGGRCDSLMEEGEKGGKLPEHRIPIQPESLDSFIKKTRQSYDEADSSCNSYMQALARNYMIARRLRNRLVEDSGNYWIHEHWEETDSGRSYGHGLSLQRVPKEVRHAALGKCHKYDFKASSYALMAGLAQSIDPAIKIADIKEYIKDRSEIRKRIAEEVGISEGWMKDIFTSVGFGASTADNPFYSIRGKLGEEKHHALMANKRFQRISERMEVVRKTIAGKYSDEFVLLGREYTSADPRSADGRKRSTDQKLAWIYQVMESHAITLFATEAKKAGYHPILFAHDCAYFKQKLPESLMADIMYELNRQFPLLAVEHEAVFPIHAADYIDPSTKEHDMFVAAHTHRIREQEAIHGTLHDTEPLDRVNGHFAKEIEALNGRIDKELGTSIRLERRQVRKAQG